MSVRLLGLPSSAVFRLFFACFSPVGCSGELTLSIYLFLFVFLSLTLSRAYPNSRENPGLK